MANRGAAFGDLADRQAKMDAKYDKGLEATLRKWIEETTKESIGEDFQAGLKSGVVLCALMNKLHPGTIKGINTGSMAFKQMENISKFVDACSAYGVVAADLFQTTYLYEGSNMAVVLNTLNSVKRISEIKASGGTVAAQPKPVSLAEKTMSGKAGDKGKYKTNDSYSAKPSAGAPVNSSAGAAGEATHRGNDGAYGDLAERRAKMDAKYDHATEAGHRTWLESASGMKIGADFHAGLKDGIIICKALNKAKPGACKEPSKATMAFKQMENISNFLTACSSVGLVSSDLFTTADLYEGTNMSVVLQTLSALRRVLNC